MPYRGMNANGNPPSRGSKAYTRADAQGPRKAAEASHASRGFRQAWRSGWERTRDDGKVRSGTQCRRRCTGDTSTRVETDGTWRVAMCRTRDQPISWLMRVTHGWVGANVKGETSARRGKETPMTSSAAKTRAATPVVDRVGGRARAAE